MTTYTIKAPNGVTYEIEGPEGASQEQVARAVLAKNPEAAKPATPKSGTGAAFRAGFENLKGDLAGFGGRLGLTDVDEAAASQQRYKDKAETIFKPTDAGWLDAPLTKLGELAGGSAPYMAAPVLAAGAAALGGAPAAVGAGAAGLTSLLQYGATNIGRQVDAGKALKDTNLTNALAAAAPQAALDMIGLGQIPGVRQLVGLVAKDVGKAAAVKIAGQTAKQAALDYAKATGTAMGAGGITEVGQQVLERMQAGLAINDPNARKEYWDSLIGGAVLGGAMAPAGRFVERGQIETQQAEKAKADKIAAAQAAQAAAAQQQVLAAQQAAQKAELDAQRGVPTAAAADESGETVQTPAIASTLAKAQQDRADALLRAGQAAKAGDFDAAKTAQDEAAQHAEVIRTLTPLKEDAPAAPPAPREMQAAELQQRLGQLQGNAKKPGLYEKALRSGDNATADSFLGEMRDLQQQLNAIQNNRTELAQRQSDLETTNQAPMASDTRMDAFMEDSDTLNRIRNGPATSGPTQTGLFGAVDQTGADIDEQGNKRLPFEPKSAKQRADEETAAQLSMGPSGMWTTGQKEQDARSLRNEVGNARAAQQALRREPEVAQIGQLRTRIQQIKESLGLIEPQRQLRPTDNTQLRDQLAAVRGSILQQPKDVYSAPTISVESLGKTLGAVYGTPNGSSSPKPLRGLARTNELRRVAKLINKALDENKGRDEIATILQDAGVGGIATQRVYEALETSEAPLTAAPIPSRAQYKGTIEYNSPEYDAARKELEELTGQYNSAQESMALKREAARNRIDVALEAARRGNRVPAAVGDANFTDPNKKRQGDSGSLKEGEQYADLKLRSGPVNTAPKADTAMATRRASAIRKAVDGAMAQMAPNEKALAERILDNLDAIARNKDNTRAILAWAGDIRNNRVKEIDTRGVEALLRAYDTTTKGELEFEGQRTLLGAERDVFSTATPEQFQEALSSDVLDAFRKKVLGDTGTYTPTLQFKMRQVKEAIQALTDKMAKAEEGIAKMQAQHAKLSGQLGASVEAVKARDEALQARIKALADKLEKEAAPLMQRVDALQREMAASAANSTRLNGLIAKNNEIKQSFDNNTRAAFNQLFIVKQRIEAQLGAPATKNSYDQLRELQKELVKAQKHFDEYRELQREKIKPKLEEFLKLDRMYWRIAESEMADFADLAQQREEATAALAALRTRQEKRVTVKREREGIAADKVETETDRAVLGNVTTTVRSKLLALEARIARAKTNNAPKEELARLQNQLSALEAEAKPADTTPTDGERRAEEQARLERLEAIPGERIDNSGYRATRDAQGTGTSRADKRAALEAKFADTSLPQPTRNKARRDILQMDREDSARESLNKAQSELDKLTARIEALSDKLAADPTPANTQELARARRKAAKFASVIQRAKRANVAETDIATEPIVPGVRSEIKGRANVATRKEITPGEQRTGSDESKDGENKTGNDNKIKEQRTVPQRNTAVGRKEQQQANDAAAALMKDMPDLSKSTEDWYAETTKAIRNQIETLEAELGEANDKVADIKQRPTKYSPEDRTNADRLVRAIESEIESAQAELDKREAVASEEAAPAEPLTGPNVTVLNGTDWVGERENDQFNLYRTSTTKGPGLKDAAVARIADRIMEGWTNVPDVQVVATEADLPARIQAQAKADNMTGKIPGLFDPDTRTVYLVAENLHTGNDVALTIAHEVAGHYGLRDMMGDSYSDTMQRLYKGNEAIRTQADARMKASPNLSKDVAVEEVLAEMAETMSAKSGTKADLARIFHAIKSWFARTLGIRNVSDAEVRQIVANARRHVKRGTPNGPSGGPKGSVYRKAAPNYGDLDGSVLADTAGELLPERDTRSFKDKALANARLVAEMQVVDMRAPLRDALQAIATAKGNTDDFEQAMYFVRKGDQASSVTAAVLGNGFPELTKVDQKTGARVYGASGKASYVNVMDDIAALPIKGANIEGKVELATTYLALQRAKSVGFKKLDFAGNIDAKKAAAIDQALKADPALKKALDKVRATYNDYNSGLVKFLADSGAISQKTATDLLKNGDYMPYYRVDSSGMAKLYLDADHPISLGEVRHQKHLAELKGGEGRILPLNESIVRNTALLLDKASTNLSAKSVAYMLQDAGAGKIVPGKGEQGPDIIRFHQEPDPKNPEDTGDRWIKINLEGTAAEGIPAELLIKSLEGSRVMLPGILKVMSAAGDLLRAGVTRTPLYLLRQLTRDPMASSFTAGLDSGPMRSVLNAGKEFIKSSRGTSQTHADLIAKGLIQHPLFTGDRDDIAKFALQIAENRTPGPLGKLFQMSDGWATQADAATRALVYENAVKNGMNPLQAEMMTMESMNFHKRGMSPSVQFANRAIPFFNAQIQGLNVLWKAMSGQMPYEEKLNIQRKFRNNAALLTVAGLSYAAAMSDDDYYKNASAKDRMTNFFLHLPGVEEPIKIPIPYEMGYFFSLGVAAIEAMRDEADGEELMRGVGAMAFGSIPGASSLFMPQLVKPALEAYTNTNFYSGRGIETASQQKLSPDQRYNASTTEMAKALSEAAPFLSPVQIEHLVKGYFGILPIAAMASANALFADDSAVDKPAGKTSDIPLLGGAFQRKVAGEDVTVAYRYVKEAEQAKSSYDYIARKGQRDAAMKYLEKNRGAVMMAPLAGKFSETMAQLKRAEEAVRGSAQTPEAKQAAIDRIAAQRRDIADRFVKKFKEMEARGEATAA